MTLISKIRAEIERRINVLRKQDPKDNHGTICHLDSLLSFLDTLEETSYDTQKYTPRPSVSIEDVARVQFASHANVIEKKRKAIFDWEQFKEVAGIFYGFGKKDKTDTLEEPDTMKHKICPECGTRMKLQEDRIYTSNPPMYGYVCPKCGTFEYDRERIEYIEEPKKDYNQRYKDIAKSEWFKKSYVGKSLGDIVPVEEPVCEELEEEVKNYFQGYFPGTETAEQCNTDLHFTPPAIIRLARHFAKWQKEQDDKETAELLTIAHLQGADQMREQMMKEAVEKEVGMHGEPINITFDKYVQRAKGIFPGDKVHIIIVKED